MIRAVLWDADGVLQVLTGRVDMAERVERLLVEHRLTEADADAVRATWTAFPPVAEAHALLDRLHRQGVLCVLATNQDTLRERHMRPVYDAVMNRCYYSCSMGLAKPDPAFFTHIADDLGLAAAELLFIDDRLENVEGARAAGLHAAVWHHEEHAGGLEAILARYGLAETG